MAGWALGVISYRSVVERRQQIGMLRAIGFQRSMVGVSFVIESLVVALLGVVSGCGLAIALSYNLISGGAIEENAEFPFFVIPWSTILFFVGTALIAAALLTWIPAGRDASVRIAEVLRYEYGADLPSADAHCEVAPHVGVASFYLDSSRSAAQCRYTISVG